MLKSSSAARRPPGVAPRPHILSWVHEEGERKKKPQLHLLLASSLSLHHHHRLPPSSLPLLPLLTLLTPESENRWRGKWGFGAEEFTVSRETFTSIWVAHSTFFLKPYSHISLREVRKSSGRRDERGEAKGVRKQGGREWRYCEKWGTINKKKKCFFFVFKQISEKSRLWKLLIGIICSEWEQWGTPLRLSVRKINF